MTEYSEIGGGSALPLATRKAVVKLQKVPLDEGVVMMGEKSATTTCHTVSIPQFSTSNLAVAAFLTAGRHLALSRIEFDDQGIAMFVFDDPDRKGDKFESGFLTQDALVPGAQFHRQLRVLRRLIEEKSSRHHNSNSKIKGYEHADSRRY
jgi:hypothetical protein